jgi:hypothetical protein
MLTRALLQLLLGIALFYLLDLALDAFLVDCDAINVRCLLLWWFVAGEVSA